MIHLGVNIDHVATLRQARKENFPDPVAAARHAEAGGANNITCHLREDRRHIQDDDVRRLQKAITTELNLEMAATPEMVRIALQLKPRVVTLVPERRQELTTEGGLDLKKHWKSLAKAIGDLHKGNLIVSLFVDPDPKIMKVAKELGADAVELHTGRYAHVPKEKELVRIQVAAKTAAGLGLTVHAGHGLDYENVEPIAAIPEIESLQIGFAIIARAVWVGLEQATREMKQLIVEAGREKCCTNQNMK